MAQVLIVLLLMVVTPAVPVWAQDNPVSLGEAVQIALKENHELKAHKSSLAASEEDIGIALSSLLPKVGFEERFLRTNNPTAVFSAKLNQQRFTVEDFGISSLNNPQPINDFQTSFLIEQPLFVQKANVGYKMAKTEFSAKSEEVARKKEEVAFKVVQAFLMVYTSTEYQKIAEQAVMDSREHLRVSELKCGEGLGLYSDVLRASTSVTAAEQRAVSARKNLEVAKRALGLLLGKDGPVEISEVSMEIPLKGLEYYATSSMGRKDISSLKARYENAKNAVSLAQSSFLPTVGVAGGYQLNDHRYPFGSEGSSWQLLGFFRWELFDGTKRHHEVAKAHHQVAESGEYLEGLKQTVSFKVNEAYLAVQEASKNTELARSSVATAEEGTRLVKTRFDSGLSPLVDLLDAQWNLDQARANLLAIENRYLLAVANLGYESGTLLSDLRVE